MYTPYIYRVTRGYVQTQYTTQLPLSYRDAMPTDTQSQEGTLEIDMPIVGGDPGTYRHIYTLDRLMLPTSSPHASLDITLVPVCISLYSIS